MEDAQLCLHQEQLTSPSGLPQRVRLSHAGREEEQQWLQHGPPQQHRPAVDFGQRLAGGDDKQSKPPLTREEARQQARAEGLTLLVTNSKYNSKTGYFGVSQKGPERAKPFHAQVTRDGRTTTLGSFSTAEEAALCIARSPEGQQEAAKRRLAPLTSEKVLRQQAREAAEFREIRVQSCEEEARHVAAKVQSCRAAERDVMAMLAMAMEATVSEEVQQQAEPEAQYATEEMSEEMLVEEVLAVLDGGML